MKQKTWITIALALLFSAFCVAVGFVAGGIISVLTGDTP